MLAECWATVCWHGVVFDHGQFALDIVQSDGCKNVNIIYITGCSFGQNRVCLFLTIMNT